MKIESILQEEININNDMCSKIEVINDKKIKEDMKKLYYNKMIEAIENEKKQFYFLAETIPDDKKSIKFTTEAISETLFEIDWYFEDNNIDDKDFAVVIISEDEKTKELYRKACEKMGFIL